MGHFLSMVHVVVFLIALKGSLLNFITDIKLFIFIFANFLELLEVYSPSPEIIFLQLSEAMNVWSYRAWCRPGLEGAQFSCITVFGLKIAC